MVWFHPDTGRVYSGPQKARATMEAAGWIWGTPPAPPPGDPEEWVDTPAFVEALAALIPADQLAALIQSPEALKRGLAGLAQLPHDRINLLDPRVQPWLDLTGLSLDAVRAAIAASEEVQ